MSEREEWSDYIVFDLLKGRSRGYLTLTRKATIKKMIKKETKGWQIGTFVHSCQETKMLPPLWKTVV